MNVAEAIKARRCVRWFKPDPVPKEVLTDIIQTALKSPSWANSQPWDVYVATGKTLETIKKDYLDNYKNGVAAATDIARPKEWPEACKARTAQLGPDMRRDCGEAAKDFGGINQKMFNTPAVIYLCVDKMLAHWSLFDLGAFEQSILLLALEHGLETIPAITLVNYPDVVRKTLNIPDHLNVALGIAIGYEDKEHPINNFRSARKSIDEALKIFD